MLPPLDHLLVLESDARKDAPFTLAGAGCMVAGSEQFGIREVVTKSEVVPFECRFADAVCTGYRITSLGVERTLRAGHTTITEKTIVAPAECALAIEWRADADIEAEVVLRSAVRPRLSFSRDVQPPHISLARDQAVLVAVAFDGRPRSPEAAVGWVRQHRAAAERRSAEWLSASIPDRALATAFAWAGFRIASAMTPSPHDIAALIGVGDFRLARAGLAAVVDDPTALFLLGRYFAASGDDGPVRANWQRILATAAGDCQCPAATLRALAHAAEAIGETQVAGQLERRIGPVAHVRSAVADLTDVDTSARQVAELAHSCFEGELGGWSDPGGAGKLISAFVYGILGYSPDAAHGRLGLSARLPADWQAASIGNIRMGDAAIDLEYTRLDHGWRYSVVQVAGAFPVRLIFEPAVPEAPTRALIDGQPARLSTIANGQRVVTPVQLVLDERRTVELQR